MEENKVENLNDETTNNVSGGFVGKDWDKDYENLLFKLGISHEKHLFHKDKYYYKGEEISKDEAFGMVAKWRRKHGGQ